MTVKENEEMTIHENDIIKNGSQSGDILRVYKPLARAYYKKRPIKDELNNYLGYEEVPIKEKG